MSRGRLGILVSLAILVGAGWFAWSRQSSDHDLDRFGSTGMTNRFFDFGGGSQLSIGSPDHHRVVVQWKGTDGRWTSPKTVYENTKYPTYDNTIRQGGSTVAIQQVFTYDSSSEDDENTLQVDIVCDGSRRHCDVQDDPGHVNPPEVTPDGRTVLAGFADIGQKAVLWTHKSGFRTLNLIAPTGFEVAENGLPWLASDGSLRKFVWTHHDSTCTLTMLSSAPHAGRLRAVASTTMPSQGNDDEIGDESNGCLGSFGNKTGSNSVQIAENAWLVREGSRWTETSRDPSGLIPTPRGSACRTSVQTQFENRPNLSYSSPDGRSFQIQVRQLRAETWSKPVRLVAAPARGSSKGPALTCAEVQFATVGSRGYAVALIGKAPDFGRAVAVTRDLGRWEAEFSPGARGDLHVDHNDRVLVGTDLVWSPTTGLAAND